MKRSSPRACSTNSFSTPFVSTSFFSTLLAFTVSACSHRPPADFAPDPGLVAQIRAIRIRTTPHACPGQAFAASYTAILNDGTAIPFETRYDRKHPPRLHVVFLERSSPDADPLQDGGWAAPSDPLVGVRTGYRLRALLRHKPDVMADTTVAPEYSCLPRGLVFSGRSGAAGGPGGDGPDITVRLAIVRSPFYERLLIAGIEVGEAPPFFVLADANSVPPRDWLVIKSAGGRGGNGRTGRAGAKGADGTGGCPGSSGGAGGNGEDGDDGGAGGRGGRITIMAPAEEPFLAGLIDAQSPAGPGGEPGRGGAAGAGGKGGAATRDPCATGADGAAGRPGRDGRRGAGGYEGPRPRVLTVPMRDIFGPNLPPGLAELLGR